MSDVGRVPDAVDAPATSRRRRFATVSLVVAAVLIAIDVITKRWAVSSLTRDNDRHIVWTLHWNLTYNSGMAFSRGRGLGPLIALLAIVVVVALLVGSVRVDSTLGHVAVGLILGGAIGNVLDRVFRGGRFLHGSVVDFIDFRWWPIFNAADIGVDVGAALFALSMYLSSRRHAGASVPGAASVDSDADAAAREQS